VRRRLVIAIVVVAACSVGLFALPLAALINRSYRNEETLRLQRDTVAAAGRVDASMSPADRPELPRSADRLGIYDRSGKRIVGTGPPTGDALVLGALRAGRPADAEQNGQLVAAVPILNAERVTGALRAARSDTALERRVRNAWLGIGGLALGVLLLAVLAAVAVGRRLAKPLEQLAGSARQLGEGNFSARTDRAGVAELDAVGEALESTARRLGEMVTRERAFSADASHQLRTPLAALRLELEAMELEPDSPDMHAALREVDRLQTTIETLLAVARDAPRPRSPVDLRPALAEGQRDWHGALAAQSRPLHMNIEAPDPAALAAPEVVREILGVLLSNAFEHGAGAVTVTVRETGDWLAIDVSDEGPGIAGSEEQAFARRTGTGDGSGIGLALARSLAHAEGGRLSLASTGRGPTFTLMLRAAGERELDVAP
jgi:signal transduction histidine kinase